MSEMSKQLPRRFPKHEVGFIFLHRRKDLHRYGTHTPRERAKRRCVHFRKALRQCQLSTISHSVIMSVVVCKLGCTQLVFVKPGTKIDGDYYRDEHYCCWTSRQPSEASLMKFTSFSRTMHRLVVLVKQWSCFVPKLWNSLLVTCGRPTARTSIRLIAAFGE